MKFTLLLCLCPVLVGAQETINSSESSSSSISTPKAPSREIRKDLPESLPLAMEKLKTNLRGINDHLKIIENNIGTKGFVAKDNDSKIIFNKAEDYFSSQKYAEAIYFYQRYLAKAFQLNHEPLFLSRYHLAICYEKSGQIPQSLAFYKRSLSQILSNHNIDHKFRVIILKKIFQLFLNHKNAANKVDIRQLLGSMLSLGKNSTSPYEVIFWAAKLAFEIGDDNLAEKWLANVELHSSRKDVDARSYYFRALIAISQKDIRKAKKFLKQALKKQPESGNIRDLAYIALARISFYEKKLDRARDFYAHIPAGSRHYDEILVDRVLLAFKSGHYRHASTVASTNSTAALQPRLRKLMPYLALASGEVTRSTKLLDDEESYAKNTLSWLDELKQSSDDLRYRDLQAIEKKVVYLAPVSPLMPILRTAYQRSYEVTSHLEQVNSELTSIYMALGEANLTTIQPFWVKRVEQMKTVLKELLSAGHTLSNLDGWSLENELSEDDRRKIEGSTQHRSLLLTAQQKLKANHRNWRQNVANWQRQSQFEQQLLRIDLSRAKISGLEYWARSHQSLASERIDALRSRSDSLYHQLTDINIRIQEKRLGGFAEATSLSYLHQVIVKYAMALVEEKEIFDQYRANEGDIGLHLITVDALRLWNDWRLQVDRLLRVMQTLDERIDNRVSGLNKYLQHRSDHLKRLRQKIRTQKQAVAHLIAKSKTTILNHYMHYTSDRLSQVRKWQADLLWQQANQMSHQQDDARTRYNIGKHELEYMAKSLRRGVHWAIPQ